MEIISIYVTNPDKEIARQIGEYLLKLKLIACFNVFPVESAYWWNGNIESDGEYVSLLKTSNEYWETIRDEIEKIHPYEIPCILKINIEANEKYKKWIYSETSQNHDDDNFIKPI
ncbi:MAG: divalent-cation tolerance protein CutA [Deltaproteobacteria bacterium]